MQKVREVKTVTLNTRHLSTLCLHENETVHEGITLLIFLVVKSIAYSS
eukprot:UN17337